MLGASTVAFRPYPNYSPWNQFLLYYAICFFIIYVPFLVVDLYYAYRDTSCVQNWPPIVDIRFSLKVWLQVDGYIILGFIVFFLILGIIACCSPVALWVYGLWEALHMIFMVWRIVWLIIGAIMFWGGYAPTNSCDVRVGRYMWSMLIIGFFFAVLEPIFAFVYPRSVPIAAAPIPTPLMTPTQTALVAPVPTTLAPFARPVRRIYWSYWDHL